MRRGLPVLLATIVLAGCSGSSKAVPSAPIGLGVPSGYRTTHVWYANLSGQSVPDVVVASKGPPVTVFGFHPADLRVLEWDPLAHQWSVAFDAQKVREQPAWSDPGSSNNGPGFYDNGSSPVPLVDPKASVSLAVKFVRLLPANRKQLAFEASMDYGGSGVPQVLAVVDFEHGLANVVYTWNGEDLLDWHVVRQVLHARASFWTPSDAHCCPVTSYTFTVAHKNGYFEETSDSRPWVGVVVRQVNDGVGLTGHLQVTELSRNAPAKGRLRVGDILVDVVNAPRPPKDTQLATFSILDKVVLFHPGQTARLLVERDGKQLVIPVRLGSMLESFGTVLPKGTYAAL